MSLNTRSALDILKRQALFTIMGNINITQHYLKEEMNKYVNTGDSIFTSLLNKMSFDAKLISSSQINSIYMLAYLDFFALYTILYANLPVFSSLSDISLKKFMYIDSLYKDIIVMMKEKRVESENVSSLYINFLNPKNINYIESSLNSRENNNPKILNSNILTLPIKSSKVIKPSSITVYDNDKSLHDTVNMSNGDEMIYSINRMQDSRIGVISRVYSSSEANSYSISSPEVYGSTYGYFSDRIFVKVSDLIMNEDDEITEIILKSSSNGHIWSDGYSSIPGIPCEITIEDNIKIGLFITLHSLVSRQTTGLTIGDAWNIDLIYVTVPLPKVDCKIKFESLDYISYAKFTDSSTYKLSDISLSYRQKKFTDNLDIPIDIIYDGVIETIVPISDQVAELNIKGMQEDFDVRQVGSKLLNSFDFNISDIALISNEYLGAGTITINGIDVKDISTVSIGAKSFIFNDGAFTNTTTSQKSFIEYNIIVQNTHDSISIPIVPESHSKTIYEFIVPSRIESNVAYFNTRFPSGVSPSYVVYDLVTGQDVLCSWTDTDELKFSITEYNSQHSYAIKYNYVGLTLEELEVKANWSYNTGIIKPILYAYYRDTFGKNHVAIRYKDEATLFFGNIKSFIEMRSVELPYITPVVYDYQLMCN